MTILILRGTNWKAASLFQHRNSPRQNVRLISAKRVRGPESKRPQFKCHWPLCQEKLEEHERRLILRPSIFYDFYESITAGTARDGVHHRANAARVQQTFRLTATTTSNLESPVLQGVAVTHNKGKMQAPYILTTWKYYEKICKKCGTWISQVRDCEKLSEAFMLSDFYLFL